MKENIILILGGGSARGLAHIGAIKQLEEKFNIKAIIGTSMGAIVGGLYASGLAPEEILNIAKSIKPKNYLAFFKLNFSGGFVNSQKLLEFFAEKVKHKLIEKLAINYAAISFDILNKKTVIINKGSLASAMLASCSIPLIFKPFKYKNYILCDGGVEYPLPIDFANIFYRKNYKVVAVNVLPPISQQPQLVTLDTETYKDSKRNNIMLSMQVTMYNQAFLAMKSLIDNKPDYYISAYTPNLSGWDFIKVDQFYQLGVKSAKSYIEMSDNESPIDELRSRMKEINQKIKELKFFK